MPINPMIPLAVGQGVPMVKTLGTVMSDVAKMKAIDAQARRLDAISQQEAEEARLRQEKIARAAKAEGIAKLYANDEGVIGTKLREAGLLDESIAYDEFLGQHRQRTAQAVQNGIASQKAVAAVTANTLDAIDDEASYNFAVNAIDSWERQALQGKPGLAADLKGMTYQQAVASGALDRMRKFARAQVDSSSAQIDAFKQFSSAMDTASDLDALYATVTSQQELDGLNQALGALRIPADLRNAYPTTYTPGMEDTFKRRVEARQGAKASAVEPLERIEMTDPATGKTVIKLIPRSQAAGTYEKPTPVDPVVLTERPAPDEGDKIIPGLGSTPNSIFQNGIFFALTGKMPPLGMGNQGGIAQTRQSIQNTGNALIAKSGLDSATVRSAYQANQKSMDRMVPLYNQTTAFANSALASLNFAVESGEKVWNAKVPTVNRMRNWLSGTLAPNEALSEFEVFVYTAARDYAKVTSGGALSIAELSVAAAQKADQLLNSAQSPEQFKAAANAMKRDMGNVMDTQRDQIGSVSQIMASFLNTVNPAPVSARDFSERVTAGPTSAQKTATPAAGTFTAVTGDGRTVTFPSLAARDAAVKESSGLLTVAGSAAQAGKGAPAKGPKPPANPKIDDEWESPMGVLKWNGTIWR